MVSIAAAQTAAKVTAAKNRQQWLLRNSIVQDIAYASGICNTDSDIKRLKDNTLCCPDKDELAANLQVHKPPLTHVQSTHNYL